MVHPYWRPNYRIPATLPDIKVVRTGFLINGVAITVAITMIFMVLQKEYRAHTLENTVSTLKEQTESGEPQNKKNIALNERFLDSAKYIQEMNRYYNTPFELDTLMVDLSNSVPEGLVYRSMSINEVVLPLPKKKSALGLRINVSGSVDELTILNDYKRALSKAGFLNPEGYSVDIDESVQAPDPLTRVFPYQLTILVQPVEAKGAK
jgi:hypothetical protein